MIDKNKATVRQNRYDRDHTFRLPLKFNKETDADIKSWLDSIKKFEISSVQGYIKRLIRTDIARCKSSGMSEKEYLKKSQETYDAEKK